MSLPFYLAKPTPAWYLSVPWRSLDLETTNKDKGDPRNPLNRIVCVGLDGKVTDDAPLESIADSPIVLVAHNAKFEMGWLMRYGAKMENILPWDTMIAEYVLAGNRDWGLSLEDVAARYGMKAKDPLTDSMMKAGVCPSEMPEKWIRQRVHRDEQITAKIAQLQFGKLVERNLMPVFFTRCIATPALTGIEFTGMRLDGPRVVQERDKQVRLLKAADEALAGITGGINLRSRQQLGTFLYETLQFQELTDRDGNPKRTPSGLRMTDADSLAALKATTKEQKGFLKLLEARNAADYRLVKSLECFNGAVVNTGSVLFGQFNQCVTQTHRLSSSAKKVLCEDGKERGAQFQNMPRDYKKLFRSHEDGRLITEADYAQLEFRIAVELAHDVQGLKDIESGWDVHRFTASVLKRKPMDEVTDDERQAAKPDTFKPLYYGQSGTPRQQAYYKAFRERYPQIAAMQEKWIAEAVSTGEQVTASGLIYYWPGAKRGRSGYVSGSPSICNYPIQAFATADIVPIGLSYLYWRIMGMDALIINTVHDSVVIDHGPEVDVAPVCKEALIDDVGLYVEAVYNRKLWVPLAGEYVTAPHWGDKDNKVRKGTL
jgi:DNA polymerase-1